MTLQQFRFVTRPVKSNVLHTAASVVVWRTFPQNTARKERDATIGMSS